MHFVTDVSNKSSFHTVAYDEDVKLCECRINVDENGKHWTISSWYVTKGNNHRGFGKATLTACLKAIYKEYGLPSHIDYIWNGANQYVMDWLTNHFDPICKLPLAVQKCDDIDDWTAHMYTINKDKLFEYLHIA
jgi:hypothetical protein